MMSLSASSADRGLHSSSLLLPIRAPTHTWVPVSDSGSRFFVRLPLKPGCKFASVVDSSKADPNSDSNPSQIPKLKARGKYRAWKSEVAHTEKLFPPMKPKRPRRGRKSEAAAVEDYVRDSLERTFSSIRLQNPEILKNMEKIMKDKVENEVSLNSDTSDDDDDDSDEDQDGDSSNKKIIGLWMLMLVGESEPLSILNSILLKML